MTTEAASNAHSKQYQWYVIITLMMGYLFAHLDRTMIGLMVGPIQADLNISDTKMSLLMGLAFTMLYSFAGIPMGYLADRWNRTKLIKYGAIIWCFMTAACGLSATYVQIFIARAFVGLGEATLMPSANSLISDYFKPHERARALSIYNLGIAAGSGLSLVLGGWLIASLTASGGINWGVPFIDGLAPWQIIFIVLGLSGFIFVAMMAAVREPARTGRVKTDAQWTVQETLAYFRENWKFYASLCLTMTMLSMVPYSALMWTPTFLDRVHGWTMAEAAYSFGVASLISSVVGMIFGGWWIDRRRANGEPDAAWRALIFGITFFVPCYVVAPLMPTPWLSIGVLTFGVFGASIATIASPTILMTGTPNEARGTAVALLGLITSMLGSGFGPTIVALLNDYVFQDPKAIGWSISIAAAFGYAGAVAGALIGLRHYGERLRSISE